MRTGLGVCQNDVIRHMIQRSIHGLIEYDLPYESPESVTSQIVAEFIYEHRIDTYQGPDLNLVSAAPCMEGIFLRLSLQQRTTSLPIYDRPDRCRLHL